MSYSRLDKDSEVYAWESDDGYAVALPYWKPFHGEQWFSFDDIESFYNFMLSLYLQGYKFPRGVLSQIIRDKSL